MKKLLLFVAVLFVMQSCNENKIISVIGVCVQDTIKIEQPKKDLLIITQAEKNKIDRLRPSLRDVAYYFVTHQDDWNNDKWHFKCGTFSFWKCNGVHHFKLEDPIIITLNTAERAYFYNLYQKHKLIKSKQEDRLYKYEDEIEIRIR